KHGRQPVTYPHERVRDILEETYGLPIYQDQVMLMAQRLAGFTLAEADLLRKAMGKKKPEVMAEMRARFVAGCVQNGIPEAEAEAIFADIEKFASYAFAKAHAAAAYAFITYWTAYFKAHFPTEFMAALLTSVQDNIEKVAAYIEECRDGDPGASPGRERKRRGLHPGRGGKDPVWSRRHQACGAQARWPRSSPRAASAPSATFGTSACAWTPNGSTGKPWSA
ncbi:MAG: hypothetical protein ABDI20_07225, partial [Candidatus Bipolaricaulaceae bacterium]